MTDPRRRRIAVSLLAALAPALAACTAMSASSDPTPPAAALEPSAWVLRALPDRTMAAGATATLSFEGGRVAGSDGCNRFTGPYRASADTLSFGPGMATTRMACAGPQGELAGAVTEVLAATRGWRIDRGELLLVDERGRELARYAAQASGLAGTAWRVTGVNTGRQAVASVPAALRLTLEFTADGAVRGTGGCNAYSGTYTQAGSVLKVGPLRTTRMACPPETMQQEAAFLAALQSSVAVRREADRLELRDAAGALQVSATAAPR